MKRLILSFAVTSLALTLNAQINFGAKPGLGIMNQKRTDGEDYQKFDTKGKAGFYLAVFAEKEVWNNVYVQPHLAFSSKGATHINSITDLSTKVKINYIELPLNAVYKHELPFGKVFAGMGPVFSYAVSGKLEQEGKTKKMFSDELKNWKRGDVGINILTGVELPNGFLATLSYQSGFSDIYKTDNLTIKNRQFTIAVGYMISSVLK